MEQYKKNGPAKTIDNKVSDRDVESKIRRLEETVDRQDQQIQDLLTEIRRLKNKLDAHALTINQMKHNG